MSDLVERLRAEAKALRQFASDDDDYHADIAALLGEAAPRLEALERIKEALEAEAQALDQKCSALAVAHGPNTCGCSYDAPGDICAAHSPQLMAAMARIEALKKAAAPIIEQINPRMLDGMTDDEHLAVTVSADEWRALAREVGGGE